MSYQTTLSAKEYGSLKLKIRTITMVAKKKAAKKKAAKKKAAKKKAKK
ncbi:MAG: hypothetical protein SH817_00325 [Leptospira sp.]|nr:hypothetical protein [Leptospira sp.]